MGVAETIPRKKCQFFTDRSLPSHPRGGLDPGGGQGLIWKKQNKKTPKPHEKSYPLIFYELFHDRIPHPEDVSERFRLVMSPAFPDQTLLRAGLVPAPGAQTADQSTSPRGKTKRALNGLWEQ